MKNIKWIIIPLAALVVWGTSAASAEKPKDQAKPSTGQAQSQKPPVPLPVYKPPVRGAPRGRVGGGTRGLQKSLLGLAVLAPDHTGLTTRAQPDLYWHLSEPTSSPIEFTLIEENAIRPILETQILSPSVPGIQRIQLSDYDVRLKLGTEYRWFVAIVADPRRRSKDILAGGFIERIEPPAALEQQLTEERAGQAPFIYAAAGIWYDALAALGKMIHASPGDAQLRAQRAALLDQVGLPEIAISETR